MNLSDIDYDLPEGLIAQKPIEPRDSARLLTDVDAAGIRHLSVGDLHTLVRPGDVPGGAQPVRPAAGIDRGDRHHDLDIASLLHFRDAVDQDKAH